MSDHTDDSPCSGGIEAVLKAGSKRDFSHDQDQAILVADDDALPGLARLYDRSLFEVQRRRAQLEARAQAFLS